MLSCAGPCGCGQFRTEAAPDTRYNTNQCPVKLNGRLGLTNTFESKEWKKVKPAVIAASKDITRHTTQCPEIHGIPQLKPYYTPMKYTE